LSAAIAIEAAELQETMLWKSDAEVLDLLRTAKGRERVSHEIADVMIYLLELSHAAGVDAAEAVRDKLAHNAAKYPVDLARGNAQKYDELSQG
jgi:NTP pyrophosphatase (non-canonical NTP hydrolase)